MCCGGGSNTTTVENSVPEWVSQAGQDIYGRAKTFYDQGYQPYTGQRQAGFTGDQTNAFQGMRDYYGAAAPAIQSGTNTAVGMATTAANAPAQQIGTERVVDQTGRLGATGDYMNQYIDAILNPQIRNMNRQADLERVNIGDRAQHAGGYGDARHGVMEAALNRDLGTAVSDATGSAYKNAFDTAMGLRSNDLDRFLGADTTNANLRETQLGRLQTGASQIPAVQGAGQNNFLTALNAMLGSGALQQQQAQTGMDIGYQTDEAGKQDQYNRLAALVSVISGTPYSRTQTQTAPADNSGIFGALGSILGGAF